MKIVIFFLFLISFCNNSFAQKNAEHYFYKSLKHGIIFMYQDYNEAVQVDFNQYIQFNLPDDSLELMVAQAKIYSKNNGDKIFLSITEVDDMQCTFYTQGLFEIDEKKDSLIQIPFHQLIPQFSISEFIDTAKIHQEIYTKYIKDLAEYLGEENPFNQFLEEMFDVKYKISPVDNKLTATLHYCDYMSLNLAGYSEDDTNFLTQFKIIEMEFEKDSGTFKKITN